MKANYTSPKRHTGNWLMALTGSLVLFGLSTLAAVAQEYKWSQELGYYSIVPDVSSSEISGPGLPPATAIDVDDGGSFLLTTTYHHTGNLSYEFFYSTPLELDAEAAGSIEVFGDIGTFEYLAPTLIANWTFGNSSWALRPYVGLGINRMIYTSEEANATLNGALGGATSLDIEDTWGVAATLGLTWNISDRWYLTGSYVLIPTDPTITISTPDVGTVRTVELDVDLDVAYLNLGYRF